MKLGSTVILVFLLLVASCVSNPDILQSEPDWFDPITENTETTLFFRGVGLGINLSQARTGTSRSLNEALIEAMDLGDPKNWLPAGKQLLTEFLKRHSVMINQGEKPEEGPELVHRSAWRDSERTLILAVEIAWNREKFELEREKISTAINIDSSRFKALKKRAKKARDDNNIYESALIWATAAGEAQGNGNTASYKDALLEIVDALAEIEIKPLSSPKNNFAGQRANESFVFQASARDKPVRNAEFVITYPVENGVQQARLISDINGRVSFRPPGINQIGLQKVSIATSTDPFLAYLDEEADKYSKNLVISVERERARIEYNTLPRIRLMLIGIFILETDLTGNPLNDTNAVQGLVDDLLADGFNVEVLKISPQDFLNRNSRELLRDLKADKRFSGKYERVLHGTVSLQNFEQDSGGYNVQVTGTLAMSDIQKQVILYESTITKTSRASDSQQSISAAFRQFGRSFAEEIISQFPK